MKHTILTLLSGAVLLLGMSSCQEDNFSGSNRLRLTASLCPTPYASRGTQVNTTGSDQALSTYSDIVTAFTATCYEKETTDTDYKTTAFFTETAESDGSTGWTMEHKYTWKSGASLRCFAYANLPASGASVAQTSNTLMTLTYSAVPDSASKQNDILLGYFEGTDTQDGKMPIVFSHPLTAVKFVEGTFKDGAGNNVDVTIKSIKMKNVYASGTTTYTVANGNGTGAAASNRYRTFAWTSTGSKDVVSKGIDTPFILIPQDTQTKQVVVEVEVELEGSGKMTLVGDIKDKEWEPGVTNVYEMDFTFNGTPLLLLNLNPVTAYINMYSNGIDTQFD